MYVVVDVLTFTEIENLTFSPAVDLTGTSIPINEFTVDIHTEAQLSLGEIAELYDDRDNLWAHYWIVNINPQAPGVIRVRAQSDVAYLDRTMLDAAFYSAAPIAAALDNIVVVSSEEGFYTDWPYRLDSRLNSATLTGFCPEQTARERLLWVCYAIGAYVKSCFNDRIEIVPIDDAPALIPKGQTYWRPADTVGDYVTAVNLTVYTITQSQGTPAEISEDLDGYPLPLPYVATEQVMRLANTHAPAAAPRNEVTVEGVYLVNTGNASAILSRMAAWYFNTTRVEAEVIDNAEYLPGDKVMVYMDDAHIKAGFITGAAFAFGLQAKARLSISGAAGSNPQDPTNPDVATGGLVILYTWDAFTLDRREYALPVGYAYNITNPYIDIEMNAHRYVFRPENAAATGNIVAGGSTDEEPCAVALDLHEGVLLIVSVDEATQDSQTVEQETIYIGVIA